MLIWVHKYSGKMAGRMKKIIRNPVFSVLSKLIPELNLLKMKIFIGLTSNPI